MWVQWVSVGEGTGTGTAPLNQKLVEQCCINVNNFESTNINVASQC